jgi:threonine dehydratase
MITLQAVQKAAENIKAVIAKVPFVKSNCLSEGRECEVWLKKESLQNTGAFKIRGAFNRICSLSEAEKKAGVIAASAGNHAQGVAFSAKHFGIRAVIVMPESTPLLKVNGVKSHGAEVVLLGNNYDEAYAHAKLVAAENGMTFVHPFEDDEVIAGQGTIALEILAKEPDIDTIVVPVGGGGLISGIAIAAKALKPNIRIIGVSAKGAPAMYESFGAGTTIDSTSVKTIADGIAVRDTSPKMLSLISEFVDEMIQVDDEECASAILLLMERHKIVVEGAGAVGVAAIMHDKITTKKGEKIATVLSGGNIDVNTLSLIIEKGLAKSHRKMKLVITLIDKPGSLMELTGIFKDTAANIVSIDYDRTASDLAYGDANIIITLESKGKEHQEMIKEALKSKKFKFSVVE